MVKIFLITLLIVGVCLLFLCIKMLLVRGGKFPNGHIGANEAMRRRGIGCALSQDAEARKNK